jgi:hypothetical protein
LFIEPHFCHRPFLILECIKKHISKLCL